jgi:hypothetical protein
LAFFRWEGETAALLGEFSPAAFSPNLSVFPAYYRLVNWDDPAASQMGLIYVEQPDDATRRLLQLSGHAADINANGRSEFVFAAEYCPDSCLTPLSGLDVFEVGPEGVSDLTAGLPGRLGLRPVSTDPLVFEALDVQLYGRNGRIHAPALVAWDGGRFTDVTAQHAGLVEDRAAALRQRLQVDYGDQPAVEVIQADAYNLLLLYEHTGQAQAGLEAFLEATEPGRWPAENDRLRCWLQLARARAQDEHARRAGFTMLPALSDFKPEIEAPAIAARLQASGYDLSACQRWIK